jgi:hypothetical protein
MGHRNDARTVLMRKERLLRQENRRLMQTRGGTGIWSGLSWISDVLLRTTIGYGYRPARAVTIAVLLVLSLGLFYQKAWDAGDMTRRADSCLARLDRRDAIPPRQPREILV